MTSRFETMTGRLIETSSLSAKERSILAALQDEYALGPDWNVFGMSWTRKVLPLLAPLPGEERIKHPLFLIAQDLEMRLGIAQGEVAPLDYRDYLYDRIEERFGSRYRFCQATGIPQAFLSQVLSGSKDFSLETLQRAADALGLTLALLPPEQVASSHGASGALAHTCRTVQDELATVSAVLNAVRRARTPARRRAVLEAQRAKLEGIVGAQDERRVLGALRAERDRLQALLTALREQLARVSGSWAPARRRRSSRRAARSRVRS